MTFMRLFFECRDLMDYLEEGTCEFTTTNANKKKEFEDFMNTPIGEVR